MKSSGFAGRNSDKQLNSNSCQTFLNKVCKLYFLLIVQLLELCPFSLYEISLETSGKQSESEVHSTTRYPSLMCIVNIPVTAINALCGAIAKYLIPLFAILHRNMSVPQLLESLIVAGHAYCCPPKLLQSVLNF